jgi:hypothetical protein
MSGLNSIGGRKAPLKVPYPRDQLRSLPLKPTPTHESKFSEERDLLEEIMGRPAEGGAYSAAAAQSRFSSAPKVPTSARGDENDELESNGSGGGDGGDLLASMAARLSKVEKSNRQLREDNMAQNKKILDLQRKNMALEKVAEAAEGGNKELANQYSSDLYEMATENEALRREVQQMTKFLKDYGLTWIGEEEGQKRQKQREMLGPDQDGDPSFDFDSREFLDRLVELNRIAGEDRADIIAENAQGGKVFKFKYPEGLPLTVYKDGLFLRRGPFRAWGGKHTQVFVCDVLDGYFPAEFKDEFPEGVVLKITDKSSLSYVEEQALANPVTQWGEGRSLNGGGGGGGGGSGESYGGARQPPAPSRPHGLGDAADAAHEPMRAEDFLSSLPSAVVSGQTGNLLPVRSGVEELLLGRGDAAGAAAAAGAGAGAAAAGGAGESAGASEAVSKRDAKGVLVVETAAAKAFAAGDAAGTTTTMLQIREEDGRSKLAVRMRCGDSIADLRAAIDTARAAEPGGSVSEAGYELQTNFPRKVYEDPGQTLQAAGLVPNAAMFLRAVVVDADAPLPAAAAASEEAGAACSFTESGDEDEASRRSHK